MTRMTEISNSSAENVSWSWREVAVLVIKALFKDPSALKRFWFIDPNDERYVRPPRAYELPEYREGMKHCTSNEKYLRPTLRCNPREPLVVALANELGAYEIPDCEFAEAAMDFVYQNLTLEMCPFDGVGMTLKRGTGSCWHLINVFMALCRAAGIKARGKVFKQIITEQEQNVLLSSDPMFGKIYVAVNVFSQGEAYVDGVWLDADVAASPEMHATRGMPISKLGEGRISTRFADPSQVRHVESAPRFAATGMKILTWFAPATRERMNVLVQRQNTLGRKIIEEAGGIEAYDLSARRRMQLLSGENITEQIMMLTRDAEHKQVLVFEESL